MKRCEHGMVADLCTIVTCPHYDKRLHDTYAQRGKQKRACATDGCPYMTVGEFCDRCMRARVNARRLASEFDVEVKTAMSTLRRCENRIAVARLELRREGMARLDTSPRRA